MIVPADQWISVSSEVLVGSNEVDPAGLTLGEVDLLSSGHQELGPAADGSDPADLPLYLNLSVAVGDLALIQKES